MTSPARGAAGPVHELVPHSGTARFVTAVVRWDDTSVTAVGEIPAAHPLVSHGAAPAFLGLELGAQAAAAMETMKRRHEHEAGPVGGRLVRVRDAHFLHATLPVNTPLDVSAHLTAWAAPLAVYRISVRLDGVERVTATLSTYATGQPAAS